MYADEHMEGRTQVGDSHKGTHEIIHTEKHTWKVKHSNVSSVVPTVAVPQFSQSQLFATLTK